MENRLASKILLILIIAAWARPLEQERYEQHLRICV
jgi:hypothetical protein